MITATAWRNLGRNLRRTLLTGVAVSFAVTLSTCMRGLQDGGYAQMIDQAVRTRLAHVQVHPEGYLERPEPGSFIESSDALVERIEAVDHVASVAPRAMAEGVAARDSHTWTVEVMGIDPAGEARVSVTSDRIMNGEPAVEWCRQEQTKARRLFGGNEELFDRWCQFAGQGRYLTDEDERAVLVGAGVARRLAVSVGDEMTVQVVRAVDEGEEGGQRRGALSQRRLEVVGLVRTGNPEIDDRLIYVPLDTLTRMLGTSGPNEIALIVDGVRNLETVRTEVAGLAGGRGLEAHTWYERNPTLQSLIQTDSQMGVIMLVILVFLVALGVINTTLMSVLERTKEFAIMIALGMSRSRVFRLIMTEVALLGAVSVTAGALLGGGIELYGRLHGWPLEWITQQDLSDMSMSGAVIDPVYHSALTPENGLIIIVGVYLLFLLTGLLPAAKAARLQPVKAMRGK